MDGRVGGGPVYHREGYGTRTVPPRYTSLLHPGYTLPLPRTTLVVRMPGQWRRVPLAGPWALFFRLVLGSCPLLPPKSPLVCYVS